MRRLDKSVKCQFREQLLKVGDIAYLYLAFVSNRTLYQLIPRVFLCLYVRLYAESTIQVDIGG